MRARLCWRSLKNLVIPVAEDAAGKGEVSCESDWYLGCAGICGTLSANVIVKQADLILAVGTKLNDFVTNSKNGFAADARFVSINTSRMDALKLDAESVVADARAGVEALHTALQARGWHTDWSDEVKDAKALLADRACASGAAGGSGSRGAQPDPCADGTE